MCVCNSLCPHFVMSWISWGSTLILLQERSSSWSVETAHNETGKYPRSLSERERETRWWKMARSLIQPMVRGSPRRWASVYSKRSCRYIITVRSCTTDLFMVVVKQTIVCLYAHHHSSRMLIWVHWWMRGAYIDQTSCCCQPLINGLHVWFSHSLVCSDKHLAIVIYWSVVCVCVHLVH